MPIGSIPKGSKEHVRVELADASGAVTDLSGASPKFDVQEPDGSYAQGDGTYANAVAASASGLIITCLVDTTDADYVVGSEYKLYVWFSVGSEIPRKGPYPFLVV